MRLLHAHQAFQHGFITAQAAEHAASPDNLTQTASCRRKELLSTLLVIYHNAIQIADHFHKLAGLAIQIEYDCINPGASLETVQQ